MPEGGSAGLVLYLGEAVTAPYSGIEMAALDPGAAKGFRRAGGNIVVDIAPAGGEQHFQFGSLGVVGRGPDDG